MRFVSEPAVGVPNGIKTIFRTSSPYKPLSLMVFLNGQLKRRDLDDGFEELGSSRFRMKEAPRSDEVLQVAYLVP